MEQYTLCKLGIEWAKQYPIDEFGDDNTFVYLGEIPNMPGHVVVAGYDTGKVYSGYHPEIFIEIED